MSIVEVLVEFVEEGEFKTPRLFLEVYVLDGDGTVGEINPIYEESPVLLNSTIGLAIQKKVREHYIEKNKNQELKCSRPDLNLKLPEYIRITITIENKDKIAK